MLVPPTTLPSTGPHVLKLAQVISVPISSAPVKLEPPKAKRKKWPFQGFIDFQGLKIDIENKAGSYRCGTGPEGKKWRTLMGHHYGEIRGTEGADGDKLDVFVGPLVDSALVVIVHQQDPRTKKYDEDKCMLGFATEAEAIKAYKAQYDRPDYYQSHTTMGIGEFWRWVHDERKKGKQVSRLSEKKAAVLRAKQRSALNESSFALPGRRYPIHDLSHARSALSRVAQHGTPDEQSRVRAAVHRRFPEIGQEKAAEVLPNPTASSPVGKNLWKDSQKLYQRMQSGNITVPKPGASGVSASSASLSGLGGGSIKGPSLGQLAKSTGTSSGVGVGTKTGSVDPEKAAGIIPPKHLLWELGIRPRIGSAARKILGGKYPVMNNIARENVELAAKHNVEVLEPSLRDAIRTRIRARKIERDFRRGRLNLYRMSPAERKAASREVYLNSILNRAIPGLSTKDLTVLPSGEVAVVKGRRDLAIVPKWVQKDLREVIKRHEIEEAILDSSPLPSTGSVVRIGLRRKVPIGHVSPRIWEHEAAVYRDLPPHVRRVMDVIRRGHPDATVMQALGITNKRPWTRGERLKMRVLSPLITSHQRIRIPLE